MPEVHQEAVAAVSTQSDQARKLADSLEQYLGHDRWALDKLADLVALAERAETAEREKASALDALDAARKESDEALQRERTLRDYFEEWMGDQGYSPVDVEDTFARIRALAAASTEGVVTPSAQKDSA